MTKKASFPAGIQNYDFAQLAVIAQTLEIRTNCTVAVSAHCDIAQRAHRSGSPTSVAGRRILCLMNEDAPPFRAAQARLLKKFYGYDHLRPKQQDAVDAVLRGHDVNMTAPTGYGKSICYILPALVKFYGPCADCDQWNASASENASRNAVTLVVSPLLALIADQVSALRRRNIPVAVISSAQSDRENSAVLKSLQQGSRFPHALLYITAERVTSAGFLDKLRRLYHCSRLSAFAIDESHCISQWVRASIVLQLNIFGSSRAAWADRYPSW